MQEKRRRDDVISRQAAMDFVGSMEMCDEISVEAYQKLMNYLEELPSAQPETHTRDCISRQMAIDTVEESRRLNHHQDGKAALAHEHEHRRFLKILMELPSAQPEIIQCKDCEHSIDFYGDGECYCRRPNRELDWIGDWNFYCGCAERRKE